MPLLYQFANCLNLIIFAVLSLGIGTPNASAQSPVLLAPQNLVATAGNARASLAWNPVAGAKLYRVFVSKSYSQFSLTPIFSTAQCGATIGNLPNGTPVYFVVKANDGKNDGPASVPISALPVAPPNPPGQVVAMGQVQCITLKWNRVGNASAYLLFRGTVKGYGQFLSRLEGRDSTIYRDTSARAGVRYFYTLRSVNAGGQSLLSPEVSATSLSPQPTATPTPLPVVSVTSPTITEGQSGSKALAFQISLSKPSSLPITFSYVTKRVSATPLSDFAPVSGTMTIAANSSRASVAVTVYGDRFVEGDETLLLSFGNLKGAIWSNHLSTLNATGTIRNDDVTPTPTPRPTATQTPIPLPTATPEPTFTPTPTSTPTPTTTPTPELTATATPEPTATSTPEPTATPTPEPTSTPTPEPTATPTPEPILTPTSDSTPVITLNGSSSLDDGKDYPAFDLPAGAPSSYFSFSSSRVAQAGTSYPRDLMVAGIQNTSSEDIGTLVASWTSDAPVLEIPLYAYYGAIKLTVDGVERINAHQFATSTPFAMPPNDGSLQTISINWLQSGGRRLRHYRAEVQGFFAGARVSNNDLFQAAPDHTQIRIAFVGDSYVEGTGANTAWEGFAAICAHELGAEAVLLGSGGTGYVRAAFQGRFPFIERIGDLKALSPTPDVIVVAGGINDRVPLDVLGSAANSYFETLKANFPSTKIVVFGPWNPLQNYTYARADVIRDCTLFHQLPFIDVRDWLPASNSPIYVASDGAHLTSLGHKYVGLRAATELKLLLGNQNSDFIVRLQR